MLQFAKIVLTLCFASLSACVGKAEEPTYLQRFRDVRSRSEEQSEAINSDISKEYDPQKSFDKQSRQFSLLQANRDAVWHSASNEILDIVASHASEEAAVEPLAWVAGRYLPRDASARATTLLAKHHLVHSETIALAKRLAIGPGGLRTEPLLKALLSSPELPEDQRWKLQLALARFYREEAEFVRYLVAVAGEVTPRLARVYGPQYLNHVQAADAEQIDQKAIKEFQRLRDLYPNQEYKLGVTVGDYATAAIFAIKNLRVGKPAPEIVSENLTGEPMKLSDFRGKVVLLAFWASWCGPCMAEIPNKRRIAEKYADRPFVIIGVNADLDRELLPAVLDANKINWKSFWDGPKGPSGAISRAWHITSWPTTYLLDHRGVIRSKLSHGSHLDAKIAELVGEAETAKPL